MMFMTLAVQVLWNRFAASDWARTAKTLSLAGRKARPVEHR
jgi:hypothetical protein